MYLIVTRTFPPDIGGMQNLMWGLTRSFSKHHMVKVFADYADNHKKFDESVAFSIERIGGAKVLRKFRKAYLMNEFLKNNKKFIIIGIGINIVNSPNLTNYPTTCINNYSKKKNNKIKLFNQIKLNFEKKIKYFKE